MTQIRTSDPAASPGGQPGFERGAITWNAANGRITATTAQNSNFARGFSDIDSVNAPLQLSLDGGDLIIIERQCRRRRDRAQSPGPLAQQRHDRHRTRTPNQLTGSHFFFLPNGRYIHIDPQGTESYRFDGSPAAPAHRALSSATMR